MKAPFKSKIVLFYLLCTYSSLHSFDSAGQAYNLIASGSRGGGSIFAIDGNGSSIEKWVDFASPKHPSYSTLTESDGKLWAVSRDGGSGDHGTIYSINIDGTGYQKMHDFNETSGRRPSGKLLLNDGKLWGMTENGGAFGRGIIYTINIDGTGFQKIHTFDIVNGGEPLGSLTVIDGKIWGMTSYGGINGIGVIFYMNLDGTGFTKVHDFNRDNGGGVPYGALTEIEGELWGTTWFRSSIFKIDKSGANFSVVRPFEANTGTSAHGNLIYYANRVFGVASGGGENTTEGVVFSLDPDGTNYMVHKNFEGESGERPYGELVPYDGKLWGMTNEGSSYNTGNIFSIMPDGTNFNIEHEFENGGGRPYGSLIVSNEKLWGLTFFGGANNQGYIFGFSPELSEMIIRQDLSDPNIVNPSGTLLESFGKLWGVSSAGGIGYGAIYNINTDGSEFTVIHEFDFDDGGIPYGALILHDEKMWGMTSEGGTGAYAGVIFNLNKDGTGYQVVHRFDQDHGYSPKGALVEFEGKLWGMTEHGGDHNEGVIFSIDTDGSKYSVIHHFNGESGANPTGDIFGFDGYLWGVTAQGGSNNAGTIFRLEPDGNNYEIIYDFDYSNGEYPNGYLMFSNGKIWGMTHSSGAYNGHGLIFNIDPNDLTFTLAHNFTGEDGDLPIGKLLEHDGKLWGISSQGGANGFGTVFTIETDVTGFNKVMDLSQLAGGWFSYQTSLLKVEVKQKRNITIGIEDKNYGDSPFEILATSDTEGSIEYFAGTPGLVELTNNLVTVKGAGLAYISAFQQESDTHKAGFVTTAFSISKAELLATADNTTKTYGDPNPIFTVSYDGFEYGDDESVLDQAPTIFTSAGTNSDVGDYALVLEGGYDNNYNITNSTAPGNLQILKRELLASTPDVTRPYGAPNPTFIVGYSGFASDDDPSILDEESFVYTSTNVESNVGSYPLVIETGMDNNYDIVSGDDAVLYIGKVDLYIVADDKSTYQGGELPELTMQISGFVNNDDISDIVLPSISTIANSNSEVGLYEIALTGGEAQNYKLILSNGILTIYEVLGLTPKQKSISIFPNPFDEILNISEGTKIESIESIEIIDLKGSVVQTFSPDSRELNMAKLKPGIYVMMINISGNDETYRIIKK